MSDNDLCHFQARFHFHLLFAEAGCYSPRRSAIFWLLADRTRLGRLLSAFPPERRPLMADSQKPEPISKELNTPRSGPEPLQGPHWDHHDPEPANFMPLRLQLQPAGPSVDFTRPEVLVGRHSVADVRLRSSEVSRRHCRFVFAEGQWQVFDLSSLNGVWVNGLRVQHAILQNKDVLHIGSYDFEVEIGPSTIPIPASNPQTQQVETGEPHKNAS